MPMIVTTDATGLGALGGARHVCWIVDEQTPYVETAQAMLADGETLGQKPVAFGPANSEPMTLLATRTAIAADPLADFLAGGPLDAETMCRMFREQSARARQEGYSGLRVVADMDWLLPAAPTTAAIIAFELLLDRLVIELDATIVCAYRRQSFDTDAISGALCVHPAEFGASPPPRFRLVASESGTWQLSGEVDIAVAESFIAALHAATSEEQCILDVSGLEFIDVAGMRAIVEAAEGRSTPVVLNGASPLLRRVWQLAHFDRAASQVALSV
jgi:anti-anti-sigma factor